MRHELQVSMTRGEAQGPGTIDWQNAYMYVLYAILLYNYCNSNTVSQTDSLRDDLRRAPHLTVFIEKLDFNCRLGNVFCS
jgi:hypothetical protein